MPAPLIVKDEVIARVFGVFRTYGYEGATIARLSKATGLGRASMYHYFPGGKDQMAREVLQVAQDWLAANVIEPLKTNRSLKARVTTMFQNLLTGYEGGEASCVINLLGIGEADGKFHDDLRQTTEVWLGGLSAFFQEFGMTSTIARRKAINVLTRIEGALILARALHDGAIFQGTLRELENELHAELK